MTNGLIGMFALFALGMTPVHAQMRSVDPNTAIDADLAPLPPQDSASTPPASSGQPVPSGPDVAVEIACPPSGATPKQPTIGAKESV